MNRIEMTIAFFIEGDKILLPLKKKKIGKDKHNGVGGKLETNETHEQAMIRECIEEVGLKPIDYEYVAELTFINTVNNEKRIAIGHVYIVKSWSGVLIETDEMKPYWFDINNIPYDKMMDDDKYWLPLILSGKKIVASFELDENYLTLSKNIEEATILEKNNLDIEVY